MKITLVFHLLGMVLWIGALLLSSSVARYFVKNNISQDAVKLALLPVTKIFLLMGIGLSVISGIVQLLSGGMKFYMSQGAFHGKLTFVILLVALTVIYWMTLKAYSLGKIPSVKKLLILHILSATSLFVILISVSFLVKLAC